MILLWRTKLTWMTIVLSILSQTEAQNGPKNNNTEKALNKKRVFPIFNVVNFQNMVCRSALTFSTGSSAARNGTCFTQSECDAKGGQRSGNCASGFGVCCVFIFTTSGSIINQNNTYIQNPGFPSALTSTGAISYTINKCSGNICWIRLDFENFNILGPVGTLEANGGQCTQDSFTVTTNTNTGTQIIPVICGNNAGQHMYIDIGTLNSDNAILMFAFTGTNTARTWDIRTSQIECSNPNRPPYGCLQYQTTLTGRLTTFNFFPTAPTGAFQHLASQEYSFCIRRESGYCCIQYQVCTDPALTVNAASTAFTLDSVIAATGAKQDTNCVNDYIGIPASNTQCSANSNSLFTKYCGTQFSTLNAVMLNSPVCDCTPPFFVHVHTDAIGTGVELTAGVNRGVCLDYMQIPCTTS